MMVVVRSSVVLEEELHLHILSCIYWGDDDDGRVMEWEGTKQLGGCIKEGSIDHRKLYVEDAMDH